ncbi:MAG: hypothetical protein KGH94_02645 [Candidatus Micrarchaeota archaeon]|nr:hypothetical protein [Candidatus Micrarchaeota archaeon]
MNAYDLARVSILGVVALALLSSLAGAAFTASPIMQTLCAGTNTANGIIPANPIIGAGTQGVTSVVGMTLVILLVVLFASAILYMVSQVMAIPRLTNFVKVELAEMVGTAALITIFFGAFYATAFATSGSAQALNPTVHFNGPARSVFVNDCAMLGSASIAVIGPIFITGTVNYGLQFVSSVDLTVAPGGFGFEDKPLSGLGIITTSLNELQGIMSAFLVAIFAVVFLLGLIYSLFPLLLYLGIVLRAMPWSRAAGGIFIAMFIGFYIVFPMMLSYTMNGLSSIVSQQSNDFYGSSFASGASNLFSPTSSSGIDNLLNSTSQQSGGTAMMSYLGNILASLAGFGTNYGAVNGFIVEFMGPAIMIAVMIAISLVVALDFADILSDLLGAPSLSSESLLKRVL